LCNSLLLIPQAFCGTLKQRNSGVTIFGWNKKMSLFIMEKDKETNSKFTN